MGHSIIYILVIKTDSNRLTNTYTFIVSAQPVRSFGDSQKHTKQKQREVHAGHLEFGLSEASDAEGLK